MLVVLLCLSLSMPNTLATPTPNPAAARALIDIDDLSAEDVASKAMNIAGEMCVYTNKNFMTEVLDSVDEDGDDEKKTDEEEKKD